MFLDFPDTTHPNYLPIFAAFELQRFSIQTVGIQGAVLPKPGEAGVVLPKPGDIGVFSVAGDMGEAGSWRPKFGRTALFEHRVFGVMLLWIDFFQGFSLLSCSPSFAGQLLCGRFFLMMCPIKNLYNIYYYNMYIGYKIVWGIIFFAFGDFFWILVWRRFPFIFLGFPLFSLVFLVFHLFFPSFSYLFMDFPGSPTCHLSSFIFISCSCCSLVFLRPNLAVAVAAAVASVALLVLAAVVIVVLVDLRHDGFQNKAREGGWRWEGPDVASLCLVVVP